VSAEGAKTMSQREYYDGQIVDHCFVKPTDGKDSCIYDQCGQPELAHLWTVGAYRENPKPVKA